MHEGEFRLDQRRGWRRTRQRRRSGRRWHVRRQAATASLDRRWRQRWRLRKWAERAKKLAVKAKVILALIQVIGSIASVFEIAYPQARQSHPTPHTWHIVHCLTWHVVPQPGYMYMD